MKRCRSCLTVNGNRLRNCAACGKKLPVRRRPKHLVALELDYEGYVRLNGGDHCAVCGVGPSEKRRLDRDHDHRSGKPRGLLCHRHNRLLSPRMGWTPERLRTAAAYLERAT